MSINALKSIIQKLINSSGAIEHIQHITTQASKGDFRESLNRKYHILFISEALLSTLSEEGISLLKSKIGTGADDTRTVIQLILSRYHRYRNKKNSRFKVPSEEDPFNPSKKLKKYKLLFKNFSDVRTFLNEIGLYSRPLAIEHVLLSGSYKELVKQVEIALDEPANEIAGRPKTGSDSILSKIAELQGIDKALYKKFNDVVTKFSYDVGHNSPVQYEALTVLAKDEDLIGEILSEFQKAHKDIESAYNAAVEKKAKRVASNTGKKSAIPIEYMSVGKLSDLLKNGNFSGLMSDLQSSLKLEVKKLNLITNKIVANKHDSVEGRFVVTFPESTKDNQGKLESALTDLFVQKIARHLVSNKVLSQQMAFSEASPSIPQIVADNIGKRLAGRKIKTGIVVNTTVTNTLNIPTLKISKTDTKKVTSVKGTLNTSPKSMPIRTPQGQFTSVTNIESLIRASLQKTILKNMQRPNLRNQTGRFAESVKLESISRARDGALSAFLSYMRYPYATFERDGKQGKKGYYPSRLIEGSVREIASKLVRDRMRVVIQ